MGVIVAEKAEGFTPADYNNFRQGCQIVNTVELALKKEFEHQGRITDELTHLKTGRDLTSIFPIPCAEILMTVRP